MKKLLVAFLVNTIVLTQVFATPTNEIEISFADTGIVGLEELQRQYEAFQNTLSKYAGVKIKFMPVTSRTAVVEAMNSKKLDLALSGPAEYVVIRKRTNAEPIVALVRPDYFSLIAVKTSSGIQSIKDLKGKKIAFGQVGSTSYHLSPMQLLTDNGIDPQTEIKSVHIDKRVAWDALLRGDVDAIGMSQLRFNQFREEESSAKPGDFKVLARGPDLPNDLIVAGEHVDPAIVAKIRAAFADHSDELIASILQGEELQKYNGMRFITNVKDSDYNYVRSMYISAGYPEYSEFVGNG
ncbi:MAG: phosphate/phosphite/phosphonate ABC transporter substrate-binding protein [Bdellovibrionales bacterium]|nr:phosphate/phosphite/phosphonate ABC transporter substrate-binding protein [Bdellovibrionales bacterium]